MKKKVKFFHIFIRSCGHLCKSYQGANVGEFRAIIISGYMPKCLSCTTGVVKESDCEMCWKRQGRKRK